MSKQNFILSPYTVQPSECPEIATGFVRCVVVFEDSPTSLADHDGMLTIRPNGKIEVISRRHCFVPVCQHFSDKAVVLGGYVPVMLDEGYPVVDDGKGGLYLDKQSDYAKPVWGKRYVQVGVSRRAWATACLFAADVIDGRVKAAGPAPTPTPPMPPLIDIRSPFGVAVPAEVAVG